MPGRLILQPANVATPETAASGLVVQLNTPLGFPVPDVIANVTLAELVVTVFPNASWIATFGCVAHATPPVPLLGCCVNPNCAAAPAVTLNVLLVALVKPVLEAVRV